jgi:ring-1,2-phenylacetyl-CoA epoxidase subunit PaaE
MALFGKLFKKDSSRKTHKGFHWLTIQKVEKLTADCVKVVLEVPSQLSNEFSFVAGQYINFVVEVAGKEERRSYSICSGPNEPLAVAVKAVEKGAVSVWFNTQATVGMQVQVSKPDGHFKWKNTDKTVVAFAAGSGITPIMAIAKSIEKTDGSMKLFYGNRTENSIIFHNDLKANTCLTTNFFLSGEVKDGFSNGRLDKSAISELIKQDLDLLKADAFFLCGPEEMILAGVETLKLFGVATEKVHYELFSTPVLMQTHTVEPVVDFKGESTVQVILDGEEIEFQLKSKGKPILDILDKEGFDAPYSCRGGVCCSCKAKILEGKATMTMNYALTEEEVKEGYILTCQAHPASDRLVVSFDEK